MCRWGCGTVDTTFLCKWCGTRFCRECLRGEFYGLMVEPTTCRKCNQTRCQGQRVEYFPPPKGAATDGKKSSKGGSSNRGRSASPSKSKSSKGGKSSAKGKKKGKKKKR